MINKCTRDTFQFVTEAVVGRCSIKKGVLGKYKVSGYFIKKETLAQLFSGEFCEISKNAFFYRKPPVAASVVRQNTKHKKCENTRIERREI